MKNTPIRFFIIFGTLLMAAITGLQIFWVSKAIDSQEEQFNRSVQMALRNVVESLCVINGNDIPSNDPIDQLSSNYFIARTNYQIDLNSLDYLLKAELQKRNIEQDYEYGVYDCQTDRMVYGNFVKLRGPDETATPRGKLPNLINDEYYFGIYFPEKKAGIVQNLGFWKATSALTLLMLIVFSYALFVILKQKRLSEVQRDFINNMTHEFKTPLATLRVSSDVLEKEVINSRQEKYIRIIRAELARLEGHVSQLLETSLLDHKNAIQLESVDLTGVLSALESEFTDLNRDQVIFSYDESMDLRVRANFRMVKTILTNLLDNAIKYGKQPIELKIMKVDKWVEIFVSNEGLIPKTEQSKIFRKFYRIKDGDRHDVKGFGLGLYFVKNAVKAQGGKLSLTCEFNKTTFKINLPLDHD